MLWFIVVIRMSSVFTIARHCCPITCTQHALMAINYLSCQLITDLKIQSSDVFVM